MNEVKSKPTREERLAERQARLDARKAERDAKRSEPKGSAAKASRSARPATSGLAPAATSFDFLGGDYRISRNTRVLNYCLVGLFAALLLVVAGMGFTAQLNASGETSQLETLSSERTRLGAELAQNSAAGGLSEEAMSAHLTARAAAAKAALGNELDTSKILDTLVAAAPSGVTVTDVAPQVAAADPGAAGTAGAGEASAAATPSAAPSAEGSAAPAAPAATTITITATATDHPSVAAWMQALPGVAGLQNPETKWSSGASASASDASSSSSAAPAGAAGSIVVTTTATVGAELLGGRYAEIAATLGQDPAGSNK